jgi:hypothetical protein
MDSDVYRSTNDGSSRVHAADTGMQADEIVYGLAVKDSFLFAATAQHGVFRSTNFAEAWLPANTGLTAAGKYSLTIGNSGIFLGTAQGVSYSTDDGDSWQARKTGMGNAPVWELAFATDTLGSQTLFAGATGIAGGVFRSTNNGWNWTRVSHAWTESSVWALAVDEGSGVYAGTETDGVYYSSDGSDTWEHRGLSGLSVQGLVVVPNFWGGQDLFAATYEGDVYALADSGSTWVDVSVGLSGRPCNALGVSSTHFFVGLQPGGVWRRKLSHIVDVDSGRPFLPATPVLHQNYPNPFNSSTEFSIELSRRSRVRLQVLDVLGQVVAEVGSDRELEPGLHRWPFDAAPLASGVYLYRLSAEGSVATRTMVQLR